MQFDGYSVWKQCGPSVDLVWTQCGPSVDPVWTQCGPSVDQCVGAQGQEGDGGVADLSYNFRLSKPLQHLPGQGLLKEPPTPPFAAAAGGGSPSWLPPCLENPGTYFCKGKASFGCARDWEPWWHPESGGAACQAAGLLTRAP